MRTVVARIAVLLIVAGISALAGVARQPADLSVTVTYSGKGPVDANNDLLVFLFDHPDVTGNSRPLAVQSVTKNGGAATFKAVTAPTVYVLAVYDEKAKLILARAACYVLCATCSCHV